jgi:beta-galactosidase
MSSQKTVFYKRAILMSVMLAGSALLSAGKEPADTRQRIALHDSPWQFYGAGASDAMPEPGTPAFETLAWSTVSVPHVFQTRAQMTTLTQAWYRRECSVPAEMAGRRIYLVFEGAATIADLYVNGQHLGQHRGAYTRFLFDATAALRPGGKNVIALRVNNDEKKTEDCLPSGTRLYKVWGGLYRKVWLLGTDSLHIDPTDSASPGVYCTPANVTEASADLAVKVLVRNAGATAEDAQVVVTVQSPSGATVLTLSERVTVQAGQRATVEVKGKVERPLLWAPGAPNLYRVLAEVQRGGKTVDAVREPTGFRSLIFKKGAVTLDGKKIRLMGVSLHQEAEAKASALADEDFLANFALLQDLGINFLRLPHYPHAQLEYDLCDKLGIFCWAENGHSNKDQISPTGDQITTEMVKQNYNHPSIAVWSVGNEADAAPAEHFVPVVKALDSTRPVIVAQMACTNADFITANTYPGWYYKGVGDPWDDKRIGYISETGAGGVISIHCDYSEAKMRLSLYEPEEYQQLVAEARFQVAFFDHADKLGMFLWWIMRDFNNPRYKGSVGWNTKGLMTYAGERKDVYYLYRCFLRPTEPTVRLTSQCYFLRQGSVTNGIKAYSNAKRLTLVVNGEKASTLENGQYKHGNGRRVDNVFYWPAALRTGRNVVQVSDEAGHADSAVLYFYGKGGAPEVLAGKPLVTGLKTSNPKNQAYYMDMPVRAQWPFYYDLDSTADNSFDALPEAVRGATWITTRRLTQKGQESSLEFTLTRAAKVYVMCAKSEKAPAFLAKAGLTEILSPNLVWRGKDVILVSAQLFMRSASAGETIRLEQADRDAVVLLKE